MWNLTKDGFTSAVAYDPSKDRDKTSPFPAIARKKGTHVLVRARVKEHLEPLRTVCPTLVIHSDNSADYKWRAIVTRRQFKRYLCNAVDGITYDSHFKEAMRAAQPSHLADKMYSAAMSTWSTFANLQSWSAPSSWGGKGKNGGTTVAGYQASKGVKPFPQAARQGQAPASLNPGSDTLNARDVVDLIKRSGGSLAFTKSEVDDMTPLAAQLVAKLHKKYGTMAKIAETLLDKQVDEFFDEYASRTIG